MALLSIQINHHAGTPKHNNYKRHDKLGYSSICYIESKKWMGVNEGSLQVIIENKVCVCVFSSH